MQERKAICHRRLSPKNRGSRQTISKWETDETIPDIYQSKKMAKLYRMTLDELIEFDVEVDEIQEIIDKTDEKMTDAIDWTSAWGKKYPVLIQYQGEVNKGR